MPTIAATGKPLSIQVCCAAVKPRLGKYPMTYGYHGAQMNNSRTTMRKRLKRIALFIAGGQTVRKGDSYWPSLPTDTWQGSCRFGLAVGSVCSNLPAR